MSDTKISALTELAVPPDPTDEFVVVDKSDTSMAASGTDKRIKAQTIDQQIARAATGLVPTGVTYQNYSRYMPNIIATGTLASGTMKMCGIWLPAGVVIASISFCSGTTALTTSGSNPHSWTALFNSSRTLLRQSTDVTNDTWSASSLKTWMLSSTFTTTYTGFHYCGLMIACGSTGAMPTLILSSITASTLQGLAPILCGNSTTGEGATATTPATALTATTNLIWCGVA